MKLILAFFKLIRWPNLFFIALTQWLFYFCVFEKLLTNPAQPPHSNFLFYLLIAASVLIAAAGYIINDYFDLQIDHVNKPSKVVVDKILKRRWIIVWHWLLSGLGILLSFYISYKTGSWIIAIVNLVCVWLLWVYSTTFKRKLLSGNIIIAALTVWVILSVYFYCGANLRVWSDSTIVDERKFFKFTMLYAAFAFVISLIREVIKDLEDLYGDAQFNCRTMPIVWGVPATKVFTAVWLVVAIAALLIVQLYAWQSGWWWIVLYSFLFVIAPLVYILKKLKDATEVSHYHQLSSYVKMVMLAGILSMLFFIY
ncbi:MAG TPA: geranylgeranylglycerol-phosphate geranylgeranyltransferase [Ferruginibacter sp.]|nr:geranylgeranylglycerol-phosphate geranylgeranyltransferase [Ferruginibacter sp.]